MEDAIRVTIDAAGRLVIPKAIRDRAAIGPGTPLDISFRAGRIEIEVAPRPVRIVSRGKLRVAIPEERSKPLTEAEVGEAQPAVRHRKG